MRKKISLATVLFLATGLVFPLAQAQENDIRAMLQQRQDDMDFNGKAMKQLGRVFKGAVPYDRDVVARNAEIIVEHSGEATAGLFPNESLEVRGSDARPEIARNRERFEQLFAEMNTSSKNLVSLARRDGGDQELLAAFARLGKTCSSCHTDFRVKD